ncbi:response regulator transcription factor [Candidatus Poribacteria bacterium]|nr:response regulator transcription factor [Candidatus Poribacteria bacterium]
MTIASILVVDDERDIRELLQYNLERNGYRVQCVTSGEDALRQARSKQPALILLDLMLPGVDGLEVCKRLKADSRTASITVVMLTAKGEEADVVVGLELGADDYLTKPFSPRVLLARIKAVLRRGEAAGNAEVETVISHGPVSINLERHEAKVAGEAVPLTALEMRVLTALVKRPGRVYTRYQIVEATQGVGVGVTDRSVDVHIVSLRRKLGEAGALIETVRGVGYRFVEQRD